MVKPGEEPQKWKDLAEPRYKGMIQLELSDSDWFENMTKYWLDNGKSQDQVDRLWKAIKANSTTAKGHTTMMQFLGAGQTAINAANYTYITKLAREKGAPVAYKGADGTTSVPGFGRPDGEGVVKDAKHPYSAWLFNEWMFSDGQKVLVSLDQIPVVRVEGDTSLDGITLVDYDVQTLTKEREPWDKKYDQLLRGVKSGSKK